MKRKRLTSSIMFILILAMGLPLAAVPIRWSWYGPFEDVIQFRVRPVAPEKGEWTYLPGSAREFISEGTGGVENMLEVQYTTNMSAWSRGVMMRYTPEPELDPPVITVTNTKPIREKGKRTVGSRFAFSPYTQLIQDRINAHDEGAEFLSFSKYGGSADAELWIDGGNYVSFSLGGSYAYIEKKDRVDESILIKSHIAKAWTGLDLVFPVKERAAFGFGLWGGAVFELDSGKLNTYPVLGLRIMSDIMLSDHVTLGAVSRVGAVYGAAEEKKDRTVTWIVDPISVSLGFRF